MKYWQTKIKKKQKTNGLKLSDYMVSHDKQKQVSLIMLLQHYVLVPIDGWRGARGTEISRACIKF